MINIVSQELGIKTFNISDLSSEEEQYLLSNRKENNALENLTFFYEDETGFFAFNSDNKYCTVYLDLVYKCLEAVQYGIDLSSITIPKNLLQCIEVVQDGLSRRKANIYHTFSPL